MSQLKYFFVNGEEYCTEYKVNVLELINYFNYNIALLVLEHNNFVCPKKNWSHTFINHNDKIEIITIVGGG